ncbi:125 kDa protein [Passion fruit mosaic virus]|nr:unnamed protein product [Passion fruit mosaic virus]AEF01558.1 125 kDa protein [Passion fruit mosaic virus]
MTTISQLQQQTKERLVSDVRGPIQDLASRRVYDDAVNSLRVLDRRPKINFNKLIPADACKLITESYPEFTITFTGTVCSSHGLAGGLRTLETEYLMMSVPYGLPTYDIGGNFSLHMMKGRAYVHCCNPCMDLRDVARNESYRDNIQAYLSKFQRREPISWTTRQFKGKPARALPEFQLDAFKRYDEEPNAVSCSSTFQHCSYSPPEGMDTYAVSVHSLYDIPVAELGPALLRKRVKTLYACMHFSEALLLGSETGTLQKIGASFVVSGTKVTFGFFDESTLLYVHDLSNVKEMMIRTWFVADTRFVYMKEFQARRVDTVFCKFQRVDTFRLNRTVFKNNADALPDMIDDAWVRKRSTAMMSTEPIFKDAVSFNVWFPESKGKVLVPIFRGIFESGKVRKSTAVVDEDFVYTILNHIRTYPAKQLTYENVLSFVESIRSRVIVNGCNVRSEWDVEKKILPDVAMTFLLITKLRQLQDQVVLERFDFKKTTIWGRIREVFLEYFSDVSGCLFETMRSYGWIQVVDDKLRIITPEYHRTFTEELSLLYNRETKPEEVDVSDSLKMSNEILDVVDQLSETFDFMTFDTEKLNEFVKKFNVRPSVLKDVITALYNGECGVAFKDTSTPCLQGMTVETKHAGVLKSDEASTSNVTVEEVKKTDDQFFSFAKFNGMNVKDVLASIDSSTAKTYEGEIEVRQMENYLDYLRASLSGSLSNLDKILRDYWSQSSETYKTYGVWDTRKKQWILDPPDRKHGWGLVLIGNESYVQCLQYDGDNAPVCAANWERVAVSNETKLFSNVQILNELMCVEKRVPDGDLVLVEGVPGCGKTKEILERCNFKSDLILTPGKEAAAMIRRRANNGLGAEHATTYNVRTFDSFLINKIPVRFDTVWVDEGLMVHTGVIQFCRLKTNCKRMYVYGDTKQIPFINRVMTFDYPESLRNLKLNSVETRSVTKRCPADITVFLNSQYQCHVLTENHTQRSVEATLLKGAAVLQPRQTTLNGKIVVFTQADKALLKKNGYIGVNTVHEVQGDTFEEVSLVRATPTPVGIIAKDSPHVLVALSRHTSRLHYYTVVPDYVVSKIAELKTVSNFLLDMHSFSGPSVL